jgi:hypothetical protein
MRNLAQQRCFNHAEREAAARCPECGRCYCRECITEHEDRVICASCLRRLARVPLLRRPGLVYARRGAQCVLGLLLAWFFFYLVGAMLISIPASVHEGTLWRTHWWQQE